jgi:hypothetical protein
MRAAHLEPEPVVRFSECGQMADETIYRTRELAQ